MAGKYSDEELTANAFSAQAPVFDNLYSADAIIMYKRARVRSHFERYVKVNSHLLELNCGTGEDALYFAGKGHTIHATDLSTAMQQVLKEKIGRSGLQNSVSSEVCSFTNLQQLTNKGPYDAALSNFAGLNCTGQLEHVLDGVDSLLKPGAILTVVMLPKFCLWETMLLFRGKFKTATRRFFSTNGRNANIEGHRFKCWYYNPSHIQKHLKGRFTLQSLEGLCTIVPPSYIANFAGKYPAAYAFLQKLENHYKDKWPWKYIGDYYILTLKKNEN